jgi:ABC-type nitrate/sulfonate/bicarbonate transport system permease component
LSTRDTLRPADGMGPVRRRVRVPAGLIGGCAGVIGLIVAWQVAGATAFPHSHVIPTPTAIAHAVGHDGWGFYWPNFRTTFSEAFKGWLFGNLLAIAVAMLFAVAPVFEKPLLQLGIASYCLPSVAILPIFAIVWSGQTPKIVLAAMSVFFTTLIGTLVGLKMADPTSLDVIHAFGGGVARKLTKVRLRAALPSLFAALRIAAPAAVLGAIIGEFIGGNSGLGVAMINSQQALDIPRTWGIALAATAMAGVAYGITSLIGRLVTPWAPKGAR